jgi:hypothetical protein
VGLAAPVVVRQLVQQSAHEGRRENRPPAVPVLREPEDGDLGRGEGRRLGRVVEGIVVLDHDLLGSRDELVRLPDDHELLQLRGDFGLGDVLDCH